MKQGILLGFRLGQRGGRLSADHGRCRFFDKDTLPAASGWTLADGVRIVPGGSTMRDGAYLGRGVICMPPMYINVGAYVDDGTMIDSHALVGSCAQIGKRVHLSAAAQIGGVLEPVGAVPVVIEDDVLVGGVRNLRRDDRQAPVGARGGHRPHRLDSGVRRAERPYSSAAEPGAPLIIPEGAVVVPGARHLTTGRGPRWGLSVATPVIVKYRDEQTDARTALEEGLR